MKSTSPPYLSLAALAALALALAAPASGQILFDAQLTGFSEVPPVASTAFGSCTGVLTGFPDSVGPADPSFHIACDHNVADAIGAHIHIGPVDVAGPIVFPFPDPDDIDDTWDLTVEEAIRLLAGGYYVNAHTPANPGGEIRGQLQARQGAADVEVVRFDLSGDQEAPPVVTDESGFCVATIDQTVFGINAEGTMDIFCVHDVGDAIGAHIHVGEPGVAGPIVIPFADPSSPIVAQDIALDTTLIAALRDGLLYVNVHSPANPGGHIRGQITGCFASPTVLCLENGRFEVEVDWQTEQAGGASGQGVAVRETDNSGMFWFFEPSNLEILIKVLDACAPPFERFWVFFSGTTNVGFDLRVTDTVTNETNIYSNEDETVVTPELDTDAFDTCDAP
jgi:hypothetical protein